MPPCIEATAVAPSESAFDVLLRFASCLNKERYRTAAGLLHLGTALQRYDVQRIRDTTKHAAFKAWTKKVFMFYPDATHEKVMKEVKRLYRNAAARAPICEHMQSMDPPAYTPKYMIKYGAPTKKFPNDEAIEMPPPPEGFEAPAAWTTAKARVGCSGE